MKKLLLSLILSIFFLAYSAEAMWVIYQKSTKKIVNHSGTQTLNGHPWVPPKETVLDKAAENLNIARDDLEAYFVPDTDTEKINKIFDAEQTPQLTFDANNKPIGITFQPNIEVKRDFIIDKIRDLDKKLQEITALETKYSLNLSQEKTKINNEITELKTQLSGF